MSTEIAKTILGQIRAMDYHAMGAWGAKDLVAMRDGFKFKTSGMVRWKGYVYVKYDEGQDLYNVVFGQVRNAEWKVVKQVDGVFVDMLIDIIDAQVG